MNIDCLSSLTRSEPIKGNFVGVVFWGNGGKPKQRSHNSRSREEKVVFGSVKKTGSFT